MRCSFPRMRRKGCVPGPGSRLQGLLAEAAAKLHVPIQRTERDESFAKTMQHSLLATHGGEMKEVREMRTETQTTRGSEAGHSSADSHELAGSLQSR